MWKFFEKLFDLGEKEESKIPSKRWVANLNAAFVDPTTNQQWLSWQFMLFKDDAGNRTVKSSLSKSHWAYESTWNHPMYIDACIPWLYNGCMVNSKSCSSWATDYEGVDIFVSGKVNTPPAPPTPTTKPSATILKLVKDDDTVK